MGRSWLAGLCLLVACGGSRKKALARGPGEDALKGKVSKLADELDQARAKVVDLESKLARAEEKPSRPPQAESSLHSPSWSSRTESGRRRRFELLSETLSVSSGTTWPQRRCSTSWRCKGTKEWVHPDNGQKTKIPLYNGTKFHRVIKNFMIQGGDPLGTGMGGPGYSFGDEVWPDVRFDRPGLLAMANSGPNTNGSQFFITTSTPKHLNMRHTIFGACESEVPMRSPRWRSRVRRTPRPRRTSS